MGGSNLFLSLCFIFFEKTFLGLPQRCFRPPLRRHFGEAYSDNRELQNPCQTHISFLFSCRPAVVSASSPLSAEATKKPHTPRSCGAGAQNSSFTSKQGHALAANSRWPWTVARGKRSRSRSTRASKAMRCEGVRVSLGCLPSAVRPPM